MQSTVFTRGALTLLLALAAALLCVGLGTPLLWLIGPLLRARCGSTACWGWRWARRW